MSYRLEGRILEVCDCEVLCPCWIGEDPDNGTCDAVLAYHVDSGVIEGTDVSGLTVASVTFIPGNVLDGHFRSVLFIDAEANDTQTAGLRRAFSGELGGPLAEIAELADEFISIERAPISFTVAEGRGTLLIGGDSDRIVEAVMTAYSGPNGDTTTLVDSIFSTIPGSPAFVSKASRYRRNASRFGLADVDLEGHNALQGNFSFSA